MNENIEINKVCRLCLTKEAVNVCIFEGKGDEEQLELKISTCLPILISRNDCFPKKICDDCLWKVNIMFVFWNTSKHSEIQLLEWFKHCGVGNQNTNGLNSDVKIEVKVEEVTEFLPDESFEEMVPSNFVPDCKEFEQEINEFSFKAEPSSVSAALDDRMDSPSSSLAEQNIFSDQKMPSHRTLKDRQDKQKQIETKSKHKQKLKRKLCNYSEEALTLALLEIREGRKKIREASRQFGVPRATLQDRLKGRAPDKLRKAGCDPILTIDGEKRIADWVATIAKCGFPIQKPKLIETVQQIVKDSNNKNVLKQAKIFKDGKPGETWYKNFLKRHPEIAIRNAESISKERAAVPEENIRLWFSQLQTFLDENNLMAIFDDPDRVLNGDESGFSVCSKTGKVLAPKGCRNLNTIKVGTEKENLTVSVVFTASGKLCPPLVVFPCVRAPKALVESMPESWVLGKSDSGLMKGNVFYEYISKDFNNWLTKNLIKKPIILFIDGHRSLMTIPLSEFCEKNGIILYALPPNTTHMLKPADLSIFRPLKQGWKNTVTNWQNKPENINKSVTKTDFCRLLEEALAVSDMTNAIKNGFRECGLFPLDANNIDYTKCVKNILELVPP